MAISWSRFGVAGMPWHDEAKVDQYSLISKGQYELFRGKLRNGMPLKPQSCWSVTSAVPDYGAADVALRPLLAPGACGGDFVQDQVKLVFWRSRRRVPASIEERDVMAQCEIESANLDHELKLLD